MANITMWQALRRISDLKGKLKDRLDRAARSIVYDKSTPPAFDFKASLEEVDAVRRELIQVEAALRIANAGTLFDFQGRRLTIAEATIILQEHKANIAWLKGLKVRPRNETEESSVDFDETGTRVRMSKTIVSALAEAEREVLVEKAKEAFSALNDAVEAVNHRVTIVV